MKDQDLKHQMTPIHESLFENFGFSNLTEIQKKASPIILQKKDCLVIAPTGSGKTECSVIPIFSLLKNSKKTGKIKALYITPLRALNRDVFRRITKYAHQSELSIEIRHGDTTQKDRKKITENPPDVLITTPETLVILLTQVKYLDALSDLEWIVVDEVHELLSSERGTQLSLSIERLELNSKFPLTKIGLSATVGNFEEAGKFIVGTKRKCEIIRDISVRKYDVEIKYVNGTISDVAEKIVEHVSELDLDSPILLFTNTRGESEFLASILKEKSTIPIELHHGSLSKEVREETEQNLREGKRGIVVCTSSLELGLDIGSVELVIHYGSPRQVSKLVQRIGRSRHNRNASAKGLIITNNSDDEYEAQAILQRIKEGSIEEQKIHDGSLDVLAHHLVGLTMQIGEISIDKAFDLVTRAYPFRNLKLKELIDVLDLLDSNYLIFFDKTKMTFWKKGRSFKYYFENLSTIPDILKFKVFDSVGKKIIGSLDQRFVGDFGDSGNIFVLKGSQWRILNIDEKSFTVNVEPFRGGGITVPYWEGENIPIDYKTARKVGNFRSKVRSGSLQLTNKTIEKLNFNEISDENNIVIESSRSQGSIVLHSCFGTKINSTLSTLLSSMLSSMLGSIVDSRSDGYRIVLSSRSRISEKLFLEVLKDDYDLFSMVTASLTGTHNVNWRTWCVAKKFGIVGRGAIYERKSARFLYERYSKTALVQEALRELFHDKYDLKNTDKILKEIREDQIHVKWLEVDQFSKLAEPILDHTSKYYSSPTNLDKGILDLVKARLDKTKHRLICARCGKWERVVETNEVKNILICPYCKGRQITATFYSDYDLPKIIRKKHEGKKLTREEKHKVDRAWKVSSLVENFGKIAIIVMSGYGVGADTAARILRNMVDEEHLLKQIYEAERQYVVTRGFWDS
ncbi:DEAD/DEAH box helicase [Nitrosopumilus piranensis]|uniref:DEAD/DEAH box helicase domain protein n=1 Tax=Nitrosopumilus piranensis TaxID=1582439 RepID=A0A0C5BNS1_9ARCH|nr:DEAD/DEAH box helicase [Nitrosopumilus piranensis]AJM91353.1 DEAD/DEAH box helicase domain protein [Nitrosopumilus piranensis]